MHHSESLVRGEVDVEFDDIGAGSEGGFHRGQGVLDEGVRGRVDALGGAGVVLDAGLREGLVHAPMRKQLDAAVAMGCLEPGGIVEHDGDEEGDQPAKDVEGDPAEILHCDCPVTCRV